ncbi:uncharacterized protein si:dkey-197j19.6 [Trichomycterus rosablanca]|uniref:uncharacterized protein si:dkey-197j19.6 n=1 Tax=Trichomycterus rosablanca TaxID=2290929 RepID=UPI002F35BB6C
MLRSKLNACLFVSENFRGYASPKSTPTNDPEVTSKTVETEASAMNSRPASKPCRISSSEAASLSLAQRKGPLPPIPSYAQKNKSVSAPMDDDVINILLPPPFPAPRLIIASAGVKKRASFSPRGNYAACRTLDFSDDIYVD